MLQYKFPGGIIKIYRDDFSGDAILDINGKIYAQYKELANVTKAVITASTGCPEWDTYRRSVDEMLIEWENC